MKTLTRFLIVAFASAGLAFTSFAGPEPIRDYKDKVVAPAPPACDWQGFYVGLHIGGEWGDSHDTDLDAYNLVLNDRSSYEQSGFVVGGQAGYNRQWNMLVVGVEGDLGRMDVDGEGVQPASIPSFHSDTIGKSDSDFYTTFRGRVGIAFNHWLFYGTGGLIGVNYKTRVVDINTSSPGNATIDAHKEAFDLGWTAGGGVEYMLNCHWSLKMEYLRFELEDQKFSAVDNFGGTFAWKAETEGNMVRAGVNFHF